MINGYEIVVLLVIVAVVVGPERLPAYAKELAALVRRGRDLLRSTQDRVSAEFGDAGQDVDWAALDPRRYDPRRIVRDALRDDLPLERESARAAAQRASERRTRTESDSAEPDPSGGQPGTDQSSDDQSGADQPSTDEPDEGRPPVRPAQPSTAPPVFDDEAT